MDLPALLASGQAPVLVALLGAATLAGFVDAVAGGGGLIQLPALLSLRPDTDAATLFGTNKLASIVGTGAATARYSRRVRMPWRTVLPAALLAVAGSFAGAWLVTRVPTGVLRKAVPFALALVLFDTLRAKDLGTHHAPRLDARAAAAAGALTGLCIGFYDGFFGPGTGSFLVFTFVRLFGFDFLHASASAKFVNLATNAAALAWFAPTGHWLPALGLGMATANLAGALVGSRLALAHGSRFVRRVFLVVVVGLLVKTALHAFSA